MVTWPVAAHPTSVIFGHPGDSTGEITLLRYRNDLGVGPTSNAVTPSENAPFGLSLPGATSVPQFAAEASMQLVGWITGSEVLAFNLAVFGGLVLTALACFALCLHITRSPWAAGIAGLAYGFNPWILERAAGHVHFTWLWAPALVMLGLILVREGHGRWAWALLAGAIAVGLYVNTYFALFISVIVVSFAVADIGAAALGRGRRVRDAVVRSAVTGGIVVVALIPQAWVKLTQASTIDGLLAGTRSPADLMVYGSRWYEWLVPSDRHPVFDQWTAPFRYARLHGSNPGETALYLGIVLLAFAIVGVAVAGVRRRRDPRTAWTALFAGLVVVIGVITSLPSHVAIAGASLPAPSSLISDVVEPWRVYARLFAVVSLGVAVLAAIGIAWALSRLPGGAVPVAALAVGALVAFDLGATQYTFSATPPPIYRVLGAQPGDAPRVEYPLLAPASSEHLSYIFHTEAAGRPLMNGGRTGTEAAVLQGRIQDPRRPWVAPTLASLGVRWVIIHEGLYGQPIRPPADDYRLVAVEGDDRLYEVIAEAPPVLGLPVEGFGVSEPTPEGRAQQWLEADPGTISLLNREDRDLATRVSFRVASFARPRTAEVTLGDRVLARRRVGSRPVLMSFSVRLPPGETDLMLDTDPAPEPIDAILRNGDPRSVSLRMTGVRVDAPGAEPFRLG